MSREEIDKICRRYKIVNYTINNGVVDVDGSVNLYDKGLTKLPLRFGKVSVSFDCRQNKLTTLDGCPTSVGGSFWCQDNNLTTLDGCPTSVGDYFNCRYNSLTTLENCPKSIDGAFDCSFNRLINVDHQPDHIGDGFYCNANPIGSIFDDANEDFLKAFRSYKVIKGDEVNLKRLKYVMGIFDKEIRIEEIEDYYTII